MDQTTLLYVIAGFVIVSAIALCMQAAFLFGMYQATKALTAKVTPLIPKIDALVDTAKDTVDQGKKQFLDISAKAHDILDSTKGQLTKIDGVVTEATGKAKVQMERIEMVLDDTMSRTHETVATVHNGIMRPLREINGIAAGIKTAVNHITRGPRPSVAQVASDEEMFI